MTFVVGDESAPINSPDDIQLRIETASDSSWLGGDEGRSFVLELGWEADEVDTDEELTIINQRESPSRWRSYQKVGAMTDRREQVVRR